MVIIGAGVGELVFYRMVLVKLWVYWICILEIYGGTSGRKDIIFSVSPLNNHP